MARLFWLVAAAAAACAHGAAAPRAHAQRAAPVLDLSAAWREAQFPEAYSEPACCDCACPGAAAEKPSKHFGWTALAGVGVTLELWSALPMPWKAAVGGWVGAVLPAGLLLELGRLAPFYDALSFFGKFAKKLLGVGV